MMASKRTREVPMSRLADRTNELTVSFKDAAFIFPLPRGATLEDVAVRIAEVASRRFAMPVAVAVRLRH
jgi:hypothetical protein